MLLGDPTLADDTTRDFLRPRFRAHLYTVVTQFAFSVGGSFINATALRLATSRKNLPTFPFPSFMITTGFLRIDRAPAQRRRPFPDSQNSKSIGFIIGQSLTRDRSGRIWIGADDSLNLYDPLTGSFKQYRSPNEACGTVAIAHDLNEDQDGLIWLATDDGLTALDPVTSKTTCYRPRYTPSLGEKRVIATFALARRHSVDHQERGSLCPRSPLGPGHVVHWCVDALPSEEPGVDRPTTRS